MRLIAFALAVACLMGVTAHAQTTPPPSDLTITWDHDGSYTTEYVLTIDGARWSLGKPLPPYRVTMPASATAALTPGTAHTVTLIAKGDWGEAASEPIVLTPPSKPVNVRVLITWEVAK